MTLTIIIISIISASFLFESFVDVLNLKAIRPKLPKAFKEFYDEKKYKKSQNYLKTTTKFSLIQATVSTVLLITLILTGFFGALDEYLRQFFTNEIFLGLSYFATLILLSIIYQLPFSLYQTFKIEEDFGFNKTDLKTFISDQIKGLLLTIILAGIVLSIVLYLFDSLGSSGWLVIWVAITLFQLVMMFLAPILILPLFNKFIPLEKGTLRTAIEKYAASQDFKIEGIYTMDGSKRSSKSNAFFTGFGKYKKIALFDTLIENQSTEELVAVLAHEIGHYKKKHVLQQLIMGIAFTGFSLFVFSQFINNKSLLSALGFTQTSIYASLLAIGLLFEPINKVFSVFQNYVSRKNEFEADNYASTTYKAKPLASALKKLSTDNLSNLTPHPLKVFLDYSHPPVLNRINHLLDTKS